MTLECKFGCDCDNPVFKNFDPILEPKDLDRLIKEKIERARRLIELQENIREREHQRFRNQLA